MPNILIRDVPAEVVEAFKRQAARRGRSLQQELRASLERIALGTSPDPAEAARRIHRRLAAKYGRFSDSVALVREDRDR